MSQTSWDQRLTTAATGNVDGRPTTVLLIVIDSLRYDRLSCYGYEQPTTPFLDSLAAEGVKFDRAYTTGPWTVPAHGSLFSGRLPTDHGSHRRNVQFGVSAGATLAGVLREAGYLTVGVSANPWLTPEFGFDAGFDEFEYVQPAPPFPDEELTPDGRVDTLRSVAEARQVISWLSEGNPLKRFSNGFWYEYLCPPYPNAGRVTEAILDRLDTAGGSETFLFTNYMDVHSPHFDELVPSVGIENSLIPVKPTKGSRRLVPGLSKTVSVESKPDNPQRARDLYDRSIRRLDDRLRDLFDGLNDRVDLDDTLIIVLSDHGECLGEHGYWGHNTYLYEELIRVPLLIRPPEGEDVGLETETGPVSLMDLPRYIAKRAGTEMPEPAVDRSGSLSTNTALYAECTAPGPNSGDRPSKDGYAAVIDGGWKFIRNRETGETELAWVGDASRPDRERDEAKKRLARLENERWSEPTDRQNDTIPAVSQEAESRLLDLGYL